MAQWGNEKTIKGLRLVPLIDTKAFEEVRADFSNEVVDLTVVDTKHSKEVTESLFLKLKTKYIGREYSYWLEENDGTVERY